MTALIFIIVLAVLVFVHELGHFLAAKMSGIRVDEFALGFPPKLFSKKIGETTYSLNMIPFGGFVKIHGENGESDDDKKDPNYVKDVSRSFIHKNRLTQVWVLIAGIVFNLLFAWLIVSIALSFGFPPTTESLANSEYITHQGVLITSILKNSPAEMAGIKANERIVTVKSGTSTIDHPQTPDAIYDLIRNSNGQQVVFTMLSEANIKKGIVFGSDEEAKLSVAYRVQPKTGLTGVEDKLAIGVQMFPVSLVKVPFPQSFVEGAKTTYEMTKLTAIGLKDFLGSIFKGKGDLSQVQGPIGIAGVVGNAFSLGFTYLVGLTALISINLALINLVPLPALDGGRILIVLIEGIIRRPLPQKFVVGVQVVSFALLILLMVVVTVKDVANLFK